MKMDLRVIDRSVAFGKHPFLALAHVLQQSPSLVDNGFIEDCCCRLGRSSNQ